MQFILLPAEENKTLSTFEDGEDFVLFVNAGLACIAGCVCNFVAVAVKCLVINVQISRSISVLHAQFNPSLELSASQSHSPTNSIIISFQSYPVSCPLIHSSRSKSSVQIRSMPISDSEMNMHHVVRRNVLSGFLKNHSHIAYFPRRERVIYATNM